MLEAARKAVRLVVNNDLPPLIAALRTMTELDR
jgi:hypothetical protein